MVSHGLGSQPATRFLRRDGKDILIDAATAPDTLNLGKLTIQLPHGKVTHIRELIWRFS